MIFTRWQPEKKLAREKRDFRIPASGAFPSAERCVLELRPSRKEARFNPISDADEQKATEETVKQGVGGGRPGWFRFVPHSTQRVEPPSPPFPSVELISEFRF